MKNHYRRDFLKTVGASGMVASLAGCGGNDGTSSGGNDGTSSGGNDGTSGDIVSLELLVRAQDESPVFYEYCQLIADNWRELGVDVTLTTKAFNTLIDEAVVNQNYQVLSMTWGGRAERLDPDPFIYQFFHSSQTDKGQYNYRDWQNDEYDSYAEQQRKEFDSDARKELVDEAQRVFAEEQPITPILYEEQLMPYNSEKISNVDSMVGEGLMSFWNFLNVESQNGEVIFGYPQDIASFNPLNQPLTFDTQIQRLVYDTLTRVTSDGTETEWAAESVEAVDNTTVRATLREGMTFHDGEPVTAEDVEFSFEYMAEYATVLASQANTVSSMEVEDDRTIVFNLDDPYAPFISNSLGTVYILPKHIWEDIPDGMDDIEDPLNFQNSEPVGSGPFQVENWRRQEQLSMTAFADHFEEPAIDSLTMIPGSGMQNMVRQLEGGAIDMIATSIQPTTANRLEGIDGITIDRSEDHGFHHIDYNGEVEPLGDPAVRRALSYAIPKQDIVDTILQGNATPAHSHIVSANEFWHNPDVPKFNLDMEQARAELEDAGYEWNDDGNLLLPE